MTLELTRDFLGWCSIINIGLLLWWFFFITLARDWTYRFHNRYFQISIEQFNVVHYAGIGLFKLCIILFNIVPYLSLRIVG